MKNNTFEHFLRMPLLRFKLCLDFFCSIFN
uniref:Uncharacterized protein n=1 Tax=Anguilla anguilla TaxID=7936 RepID=A0A0E9TPH5_ANGAN